MLVSLDLQDELFRQMNKYFNKIQYQIYKMKKGTILKKKKKKKKRWMGTKTKRNTEFRHNRKGRVDERKNKIKEMMKVETTEREK